MSATAHDAGALDEFAPDTARRVVLGGRPVAVARIGDDLFAIEDVCSHANVALSEGELWCAEREIECPRHGSTFSLITGEALTLPATQPVPVFPVEVVDGRVLVTVPTDEEDPA